MGGPWVAPGNVQRPPIQIVKWVALFALQLLTQNSVRHSSTCIFAHLDEQSFADLRFARVSLRSLMHQPRIDRGAHSTLLREVWAWCAASESSGGECLWKGKRRFFFPVGTSAHTWNKTDPSLHSEVFFLCQIFEKNLLMREATRNASVLNH